MGDHTIKTWSTTQDVLALSSGEAEFYALVKCGSQALGLKEMMSDLGLDLRVHLKTDASAALGIANRGGMGKVRHVEVSQLWMQQKVRNKEIKVVKVKGEENLADALTKYVGKEVLDHHREGTGLEIRGDRHELMPKAN